MDPRFQAAVAVVLKHEGGFVDDPDDPGGATNYGISLRFLRRVGELDGADADLDGDGDIDADDIHALSRADAERLYRELFWERYGYGRLHLIVATKVFDLAVNMGPRQAHKVLQRACRACGHPLVEDGIIGPKTLATVQTIEPARLVVALRAEAAGFYRCLVALKPALARFERGWLNRAYS